MLSLVYKRYRMFVVVTLDENHRMERYPSCLDYIKHALVVSMLKVVLSMFEFKMRLIQLKMI